MATPETEALAEAWASIDGKSEQFKACKDNRTLEDELGTYLGYIADAEEMMRRLNKRGFVVMRVMEAE